MRTTVPFPLALIACCCTLALSTPAAADTIYVNNQTGDDTWSGLCETWDGDTCGPKATIQAGIDAATDGDEVIIANGTYTGAGNKDLDFNGKPITVRSASGNPELCIIDCEQDGRGFYFHTGEGPDSVVEALTITNGYVDSSSPGGASGGGIYCNDSSPSLEDCIVSANSAIDGYLGLGGGLCCDDASPALVDCEIRANTASAYGGGIRCSSGSPTFTTCVIELNVAEYQHGSGGGVSCASGDPSFTACLIRENAVTGEHAGGGGVSCGAGSPSFIDCVIAGNSASGEHANSGGVRCSNSSGSPMFSGCTIRGNVAMYGAGGVSCVGSALFSYCLIEENTGNPTGGVSCTDTAVLEHCTIRKNVGTGEWGGGTGGVACSGTSTLANCLIAGNMENGYLGSVGSVRCSGSPILTNCTIFDNERGVSCGSGAVTLTNCIIWNRSSDLIASSGAHTITYCNIREGTGEPWFGEGCIDTDPRLTPDGHLTAGSPCRDAGDPNGDYANQADLDGEIRVVGGRVDMGADEWLDGDDDSLPNRWEQLHFNDPFAADPNANEDGDERPNSAEYEAGSDPHMVPQSYHVATTGDDSWDGLCAAWDGETCGPKLTIQAAIDECDPYEGDIVQIADGTYTGPGNKNLDYQGKAISLRSASNNPELCIIDCEQDGRAFYFHNGEDASSVISGLTITNGSAPSGGAGIRCEDDCSPTVTDCIITENVATGTSPRGGGISCSVRSSALIRNCVFSYNEAADSGGLGGAIFCAGASPRITTSTFHANMSSAAGGALYFINEASALVENCHFTWNFAIQQAGAIMFAWSDSTIVDCSFTRNSSPFGGAVSCWESSPTIARCTFYLNEAIASAYSGTGGVAGCAYGGPVFEHCTMANNSATDGGGAIHYRWESHPTFRNCLLLNNSAAMGGAILSGDESSFNAHNCTFTNNEATQGSALACDSYNQADPSYPILNNCILRNTGGDEIWINDGSVVTVTHSNIQNGTGEPWFGEGCIDTDPLFVDPDGPDNDPETWEDNDYRLTAASPCIDAGDPLFEAAPGETDLDGYVRIWDGNDDDVWIVDMGAYEFGSYPVGDCNCDGTVTFDDIQPFVRAIEGEATYYTYYPDCRQKNADANHDGQVTFDDIQPFIRLLD